MDPTLYIAAVFGDIGVLQQHKDKLADETTPKNNTVLHLVSHFDKTECIPEIISMVPSLIRRVNSNNESALHVAARKGHYGVVRELIRCAVSLESGVESGVGSVKEMLRMRNKHGDTALYDAVRYKHGNVVEVLIREDAEFSHPPNNAGETPLYIAAEGGYDDLVDVILNTCTSPAYGGPNGRTALHAAIFSNSQESTRRLLAWKQSLIKETDERGWSPFHYAAFFNHEEIVSYLLSLDGSIAYLVDNDTNTGLHIAARQGWIGIARKLILCRPDCGEIVNGKGQNMLHIALEHEKDEFVEHVLRNTPLHQLAASESYAEKLIYHAMADKKALNNENLTPLDRVNDDADLYPELQAAGATPGLRNSINIGEGKGRINQNEDDEKRRKEDAEKRRKEDLYKLRKTVRLAIFAVVAAIGAMMVAFSTGTYVVLAQTSALAIVTCVIGVLFIPIYVFKFCKSFLDDEI